MYSDKHSSYFVALSCYSLLVILSFAKSLYAEIGADNVCRATCVGDECTFNVKVNLFASELGHFEFEECGDQIRPTLGIEYGKTYYFVQSDITNFYHPLGLAYYPDGAHDDVDELEPGIAPPGSSSTCGDNMSCPAPMYFVNGTYAGKYSNNDSITNPTANEDNFGLHAYEPLFFHPIGDWKGYGEFKVALKFDETSGFNGDIFYFCHIHQFMSGRIKFLKNDEVVHSDNLPSISYAPEDLSTFDETCGTYGLTDFQLPHPECPEKFVCDAEGEVSQYAKCIDAMNCHMVAGMTTYASAKDSVALFILQMIPHHQNAVNMAKATLKGGHLNCDDIDDEENPDCEIKKILYEIINGQNAQIQAMRAVLEAKNYPTEENEDCKVIINKDDSTNDSGKTSLLSKVAKYMIVYETICFTYFVIV